MRIFIKKNKDIFHDIRGDEPFLQFIFKNSMKMKNTSRPALTQ